jgi:exopolysaccharide production protein ExoY
MTIADRRRRAAKPGSSRPARNALAATPRERAERSHSAITVDLALPRTQAAAPVIGGHLLYVPLKRALDLIVSLTMIVFGAPIFLLVAAAVVLESGRPVLYRGWRVGQHGRAIRILKFRTMQPNSDAGLAAMLLDPTIAEEFHATFKLKHDPRCTRMGRLLRRTSLDELPQIWNVVRGDMSLVGPRPIVTDELPRYRAVPTAEDAYLSVRPGLTGAWQTSGRSDTTYDERVRLDMDYVAKRGLALDLKIMARTPRAALSGHGAY